MAANEEEDSFDANALLEETSFLEQKAAASPPRRSRSRSPSRQSQQRHRSRSPSVMLGAEGDDVDDQMRLPPAPPPPPGQQQQQAPRIDLTDDAIDWKAWSAEDQERGRAEAVRRGWDPDTYAGDGKWCAACMLRPKSQQVDPANPFWKMNLIVAAEYCSTSMATLLEKLQTQFTDSFTRDLVDGQTPLVARWWSRRQIYEHLHQHNVQEGVQLEQNRRRANKIADEMYHGRAEFDQLQQKEVFDLRKVGVWRTLIKDAQVLRKDARKQFLDGEKRYFC
jgi:hypothetical protein